MAELSVNDKCLAYHGPLLYEAKVLKIHEVGSKVALTKQGEEDIEDDEIPAELANERVYFVHYKGWKNSWDEWVGIGRLREFNIENLRLQKELKKAALSATSSVSASSGKRSIDVSKSMNGSGMSRANKRRSELELENEQEYLKKPEIIIIIPDSLKSLLVDDWELVTKDHQLVKIPAKPNVEDILNKFRRSLGKKSVTDTEILSEFLTGLKVYFNRCLGNILLYRFERQQYLEITKTPKYKNQELSKIYGAEHLMRLIVSLPALIAQTTMDQQSVGTLKEQLEDLLQFLDRNKKEIFLKNYENVSPGYEALAKSV